jgi:hypothetical protein
MPAYIIFVREHTRNRAELDLYAKQAPFFWRVMQSNGLHDFTWTEGQHRFKGGDYRGIIVEGVLITPLRRSCSNTTPYDTTS